MNFTKTNSRLRNVKWWMCSNALFAVEPYRVVATIGGFFSQVIILRETPSRSQPAAGFFYFGRWTVAGSPHLSPRCLRHQRGRRGKYAPLAKLQFEAAVDCSQWGIEARNQPIASIRLLTRSPVAGLNAAGFSA